MEPFIHISSLFPHPSPLTFSLFSHFVQTQVEGDIFKRYLVFTLFRSLVHLPFLCLSSLFLLYLSTITVYKKNEGREGNCKIHTGFTGERHTLLSSGWP